MARLMQIQDKHAPAPTGMALFRLGFRPFYLLAAICALLSVPCWVASYSGWGPGVAAFTLTWHMHEMLFGFGVAVIVGFLYTAGANWTGLPTPRGAQLAALCGLWLAGRAGMLVQGGWVGATLDLAFLPCAALVLWRVLRKARSVRNYQFVVLLMGLFLCNLLFHLGVAGRTGIINPIRITELALCLVLTIATVMGGRVIPMFTCNVLRHLQTRQQPRLDRWCVGLTAATGVVWAAGSPPWLVAAVAAVTALLQLARMRSWHGWATGAHPLLWILHLSYAWIPAGFGLLAASQAGWVPDTAAVHGLAVGAMSGLIVAMITRTALGHTGRALVAQRAEIGMYGAIQAAALLRVAAACVEGSAQEWLLAAATLCFMLTFGVYLMTYLPKLTRSRIDGRDG